MTLFPTQEIGSLPKATPAVMAEWRQRLGLPNPPPDEDLAATRSRFNLAFLRAAGLDTVYDGEAHRIEMAEHPYRSIVGTEFVGHVRSFDNKYFRKAAVRQRPTLKAPYHSDEFRFVRSTGVPVGSLKVPVTGAYTLAEWAFNDYFLARQGNRYGRESRGRAQRELVLALARGVLRPTIEDLVQLGARRIQVDEPALGTHRGETSLAVEGFEEAVKGLDAEFSIHLCYSDWKNLLPAILEAKSCREWAVELANRDSPGHDAYRVLAELREYGDRRRVGVGVVDVHRDPVESAAEVADRIARASRYLGDPERLRVNPDCGLRTRSWEVIWGKLQSMVAGAEEARRTVPAA